MIQVILTAYVVVKWFGAWRLFSGAIPIFMYSGLCLLAALGFVSGLVRPPGLFKLVLGWIFDGGGDGPLGGVGVIVTPILWILFFILYPLGLVDWLVALHVLESNTGYILSHKAPSTIDIVILLIVIAMLGSPILWIRKMLKKDAQV